MSLVDFNIEASVIARILEIVKLSCLRLCSGCKRQGKR
ncbi:Uncharacterised protein [Segatella copri]|nr:Uncharacterised protein [Segatella copri]